MEAALTYDDLLKNFVLYVDPKKLQGTKDDAAVMHLLSEASPQSIASHAHLPTGAGPRVASYAARLRDRTDWNIRLDALSV